MSLSEVLEGDFFNEYIKAGMNAIVTNGDAGSDEHFFALSAYGFKSTAVEQQEGYTILSLPRVVADGSTTSKAGGTGGEKTSASQGRDFVLWKRSAILSARQTMWGLLSIPTPKNDINGINGHQWQQFYGRKDPYFDWAGPYAIRNISPDSGYETATTAPSVRSPTRTDTPFKTHLASRVSPRTQSRNLVLKLHPPTRKPPRLVLTGPKRPSLRLNPLTRDPQHLLLNEPEKPFLQLNPPKSNKRINKSRRKHQTRTLNPPCRHKLTLIFRRYRSLKLNPPRPVQSDLAAQEKDENYPNMPGNERLHRETTPFPQQTEHKDYIWICCPEAGEPIPPKQPDMRLVVTSLGRVWVDFNDIESGRYEDLLM
ncbi:MAG: hypothetical protein Q9217_006869 [Psora testacea]